MNDGSKFSSFRLPSVTLSSLILKNTHNSTTPPVAPLPLFLPLSCLFYPKHNRGPCIKVSPKGVSLQETEMKDIYILKLVTFILSRQMHWHWLYFLLLKKLEDNQLLSYFTSLNFLLCRWHSGIFWVDTVECSELWLVQMLSAPSPSSGQRYP